MDSIFPTLTIQYFLSLIKPYGNLVYEYNPFRNYRLSKNMDSNGNRPGDDDYDADDPDLIEAGTVIDLDTDLLNFDLNSPVELTPQISYDGSVNLIFNDNKNIPRLINSRFTVLENNTYEIVDRIGNNDTNLYDEDLFDMDTSLYKRVINIPKITFNGVTRGGNLSVGNYVIYIKYADADDNETDFVAESGIVSCFIGEDCDPFSILGGFEDLNSYKAMSFTITNIDSNYDYVKVYYTRTTSSTDENRATTAFKILRKFVVRNNTCSVLVTGDENSELIPLSEINIEFFIADKAKTLAVCQNMLFLGNVNKPDLMYEDLLDVSLRILPYILEYDTESTIGFVDYLYNDSSSISTPYEYYNTLNIYYHVGYWSEEIYRLGIVYIMNDGSLSPVYNIRGKNKIPTLSKLFDEDDGYITDEFDLYTTDSDTGEETRQYITSDESTYQIENSSNLENVKGVIRLKGSYSTSTEPLYSIGIFIPGEVVTYLKGKVLGYFIVRLKRLPTILAQAFVMPMDRQSCTPVIKTEDTYLAERFLTDALLLTQDYSLRIWTESNSDSSIVSKYENISQKAAICPEFEVNQPYFNQLFTGTTYVTRNCKFLPTTNGLVQSSYSSRHYYNILGATSSSDNIVKARIAAVADNTPIVVVEGCKFRGRAGEAEEAYKFEYLGSENEESDATNLIRGSFYPYLGLIGDIEVGNLITIYIPDYLESDMYNYFSIRYDDNSPYYAIGDRIAIADISSEFDSTTISDIFGYYTNYFRGDCYICNFTHRLNRNFQDPDAPTNDKIVDEDTWEDNYDVDETENFEKINRGDVNAIELGNWITVKYRCTYNLSIRSLDPSYPTEEGLTGLKRGFYPLLEMSTEGNAKIPDSYVINMGFSSTVSEKVAFTLPDVPYIKNRFDNRILYSDIAVTDAFRNGFRVFLMLHYMDYPRTHGGIMRLLELQGSLLCVFEHGIALIPVNERAVAGEGAGGNVFINTSNVLPDNPRMLSDMYGTQWPESVIKTPYYVYGVDTVARKIWRTNGVNIEIISDFRIQQYLNNNISLTERELTPIIGIRNVKSHYNAYKLDVMFTFYDNKNGFEEVAWNICYNELLQKWVTFYSWIPSYSANIDNIYFTFDRNTSKWISKLGTTSANSTSADGIVLETPLIDEWTNNSVSLDIVNRSLPNDDNTGVTYTLTYELLRDNWGNYKYFSISGSTLTLTDTSLLNEEWDLPVIYLNIQCNVALSYSSSSVTTEITDYIAGWTDYLEYNLGSYLSVIALTTSTIVNNAATESPNLTTDFWKHGLSGIIDIKDNILPCYWFGKLHPFEFEVIVADNPLFHKIFNNLLIISNKAIPESFHYEVVGEVYDFADDKKNMFIRLEATKAFYQYNGSDIVYDDRFLELTGELRKGTTSDGTAYNDKSTVFPLYYSRVDTINEIEDYYRAKTSDGKDYVNLSGTEVVYDDLLNEFKVWTHVKGVNMATTSRLRGNMEYQEDLWNVLITPIIFVQKNEEDWNTYNNVSKVPISVGNSPLPNDLVGFDIDTTSDVSEYMPDELVELGYDYTDIDTSDWWSGRKETRLRDKFLRVRIRYAGDELAIIHALKTLYTISYA